MFSRLYVLYDAACLIPIGLFAFLSRPTLKSLVTLMITSLAALWLLSFWNQIFSDFFRFSYKGSQ